MYAGAANFGAGAAGAIDPFPIFNNNFNPAVALVVVAAAAATGVVAGVAEADNPGGGAEGGGCGGADDNFGFRKDGTGGFILIIYISHKGK